MRERLKKILAHVTRGWDEEPTRPHSRMRLLPPFIWELLSYLIALRILYEIIAYLYSKL